MRIGNALPSYVARAYGVTPPGRARAVPPMSPPAAPVPARSAQPKAPPVNLIAGIVRQPVEFETRTIPSAPHAASFPLYTRAADKVEAAVGVQVGRVIDSTA